MKIRFVTALLGSIVALSSIVASAATEVGVITPQNISNNVLSNCQIKMILLSNRNEIHMPTLFGNFDTKQECIDLALNKQNQILNEHAEAVKLKTSSGSLRVTSSIYYGESLSAWRDFTTFLDYSQK